MELFQRLTTVSKLNRQPIEQFAVGRLSTHATKIVARRDQPLAEMILPNSIDNRSPYQRMLALRQPPRQIGTPL